MKIINDGMLLDSKEELLIMESLKSIKNIRFADNYTNYQEYFKWLKTSDDGFFCFLHKNLSDLDLGLDLNLNFADLTALKDKNFGKLETLDVDFCFVIRKKGKIQHVFLSHDPGYYHSKGNSADRDFCRKYLLQNKNKKEYFSTADLNGANFVINQLKKDFCK